ncbi:helix-turn-helix transcriptional regulator [Natroniella sp. ANB-PHB2]|uniref:helix-turn-helix transcriptional regulator n=1 Tax=Natroniella sp. ANB-PHB2 TaxID=3384444 RepID=UPI0038D35C31
MRYKLVNAREKEDLTQEEVAEMLNITRGHYGHIETGRRNPSIKLAIDIADLFGMAVENIFLINNETECIENDKAS